MGNLRDYFRELLTREQVNGPEPVAQWTETEVAEIQEAFALAIEHSDLKTTPIPIRPRSKPQSVGNQIATFFSERLNQSFKYFDVERCRGQGYPDMQLRNKSTRKLYALELKASSNEAEQDSQRIVLACSSRKLREQFREPPQHLIATVFFERPTDDSATFLKVKLDFLQPESEVDVRLEASVNQRILSEGSHPTKAFELNQPTQENPHRAARRRRTKLDCFSGY